ncbi:hypothetical protein FHS25_006580 [Rhizobium laguerreae]|uniref:Uncharacterized protein n=1 Tax=Rhizobium laguerreae TaxID=1076926 RepID=A0ABR6GIJ5_9HYPH|nr:hypothetical protein [Rhizobium laguerreae]MBB3166064.1 hypothetical protein [Rhizobium laguerreae]
MFLASDEATHITRHNMLSMGVDGCVTHPITICYKSIETNHNACQLCGFKGHRQIRTDATSFDQRAFGRERWLMFLSERQKSEERLRLERPEIRWYQAVKGPQFTQASPFSGTR